MYSPIVQIKDVEFGLVFDDGIVEVIAIQHSTNYVRTLAEAKTKEEGLSIMETCIQCGFSEVGLNFKGIPNFRIRKP